MLSGGWLPAPDRKQTPLPAFFYALRTQPGRIWSHYTLHILLLFLHFSRGCSRGPHSRRAAGTPSQKNQSKTLMEQNIGSRKYHDCAFGRKIYRSSDLKFMCTTAHLHTKHFVFVFRTLMFLTSRYFICNIVFFNSDQSQTEAPTSKVTFRVKSCAPGSR